MLVCKTKLFERYSPGYVRSFDKVQFVRRAIGFRHYLCKGFKPFVEHESDQSVGKPVEKKERSKTGLFTLLKFFQGLCYSNRFMKAGNNKRFLWKMEKDFRVTKTSSSVSRYCSEFSGSPYLSCGGGFINWKSCATPFLGGNHLCFQPSPQSYRLAACKK